MPKLPRRCVAALLAVLAPLASHGQSSPYYLGASQSFGYDSNIFRLPDRTEIKLPDGRLQVIEPESSGLISNTLLLAGIDQRIGRQRLYADLSAGYAKYFDQPQLDSPTSSLTAGIDWETVGKLSGNAEYRAGRRLGDFGDRDVPTGRGQNEERYQRFDFVARLGDVQRSRAWLVAGYTYDEVRNDVAFEQPAPFRIDTDPITGAPIVRFTDGYQRDESFNAVTLGARYRWSGALVLGAGLRTESRRSVIDRNLIDPVESVSSSNDSRRNDIDLFATFNTGGAHDLQLRLSYGATDYELPTQEDLSGWSGNLRWTWRPTARLDSNLRLLYDTEDREGGGASAADGSGFRDTLALEWQLRYALTDKLNASLGANGYRRDYQSFGGFTDTDTSLSVGLTWAALRNATVGCSISTQRRHSTSDTPGHNSFDAMLASCYGQLFLR